MNPTSRIPKKKVYVIELAPEVRVTRVEREEGTLLRTKGAAFVKGAGVQARPFQRGMAYIAHGPTVLPWPRDDVHFDVDDEGQKAVITPEELDRLVDASDTEAMMRGAAGRDWPFTIMAGLAGMGVGTLFALIIVKLLKIGVAAAVDPASAPLVIASQANATMATYGGA